MVSRRPGTSTRTLLALFSNRVVHPESAATINPYTSYSIESLGWDAGNV